MSIIGDTRDYIEAIEKIVIEERLNKEDNVVARALLHVKATKEILQHDDNPRVHSKWFLTLQADYDRLCNIVIRRLKRQRARAEARLRPDA